MKDCVSSLVLLDNSLVDSSTVSCDHESSGVTIYEVLRVVKCKPLFVEDHVDRMVESARLLEVPLGRTRSQLISEILFFIDNEKIETGNVKLVFTSQNSRLMIYQSRHSYPSTEMYSNGVKTATLRVERDNPNAKNIQPFKVVAEDFITRNGLYEAILVDSNGNVTEGSRSNIFFIKGVEVITALPQDVLLGITRKYVLEACKTLRLSIMERKISVDELPLMDAVFISGTSPKVLPVATIDTLRFSATNQMLRQIMDEYEKIIVKYIENHNQ